MNEFELGDWVRVVGKNYMGETKYHDRVGMVACSQVDSDGEWNVGFLDSEQSYFKPEALEAVPDPKMEAFKARVVEVVRHELMPDIGDPILESLGILPRPVRRSVTFEFDEPGGALVDPLDIVSFLKDGIQFHTSNITCIPDTVKGDK